MVMMTGLIGIIVLKVVPAFSDFYSNFDRELPLSTRVIVSVSNAAVSNIWFVLLGLAGAAVAVTTWVKQTAPAQPCCIGCCCTCPGWARRCESSVRHSWRGRSRRCSGAGFRWSMPSTSACGRCPTGIWLLNSTRSADSVQEGQSFAASLRTSGAFPDVAVKMVEVGESTGALQEMLNSLADFYDEEIETEVARFITLVEPILLVVMGAVIALVVLALYMPLFELSAVVGG